MENALSYGKWQNSYQTEGNNTTILGRDSFNHSASIPSVQEFTAFNLSNPSINRLNSRQVTNIPHLIFLKLNCSMN